MDEGEMDRRLCMAETRALRSIFFEAKISVLSSVAAGKQQDAETCAESERRLAQTSV